MSRDVGVNSIDDLMEYYPNGDINYDDVVQSLYLSEEFIKEHIDKLDKNLLFKYQNLSLSFVLDFINYFDIQDIIKYMKIEDKSIIDDLIALKEKSKIEEASKIIEESQKKPIDNSSSNDIENQIDIDMKINENCDEANNKSQNEDKLILDNNNVQIIENNNIDNIIINNDSDTKNNKNVGDLDMVNNSVINKDVINKLNQVLDNTNTSLKDLTSNLKSNNDIGNEIQERLNKNSTINSDKDLNEQEIKTCIANIERDSVEYNKVEKSCNSTDNLILKETINNNQKDISDVNILNKSVQGATKEEMQSNDEISEDINVLAKNRVKEIDCIEYEEYLEKLYIHTFKDINNRYNMALSDLKQLIIEDLKKTFVV